ncbi:hypothetical protein SAMN05216388_103414 [Halorientalis persicus]|uniref:Uncharacterized protein n=1 Tax=Halorientalis persicus TaxID=1367881 RepID=A0A1H8V7C4_9EURY|nr:hypothetical protein SAMN05216388_103414 [Halorientalis persicus]
MPYYWSRTDIFQFNPSTFVVTIFPPLPAIDFIFFAPYVTESYSSRSRWRILFTFIYYVTVPNLCFNYRSSKLTPFILVSNLSTVIQTVKIWMATLYGVSFFTHLLYSVRTKS